MIQNNSSKFKSVLLNHWKFWLRLSTFFSAVAISVFATPVSDISPLIPARELQADFAILKRAYKELHPGLYWYNSKTQMERNFNTLKAEMNRDLTLQEVYVALSLFLAKIKCGHSYPNFYNQPKAVADLLFKGKDKVPFYFRWRSGSETALP